jgi:nucleoside-triphosphatase THEP1
MTRGAASIWIITGTREAGKTRFCQKVIEEARTRGLTVGGILSPAVFENGVKTGINAQNLASGEMQRLATVREEVRDAITPRWSFDEKSLAWGSVVLKNSAPCDLLVVDELGPLELQHSRGWIEGIEVLNGGEYRAALVVIRQELLETARQLWPQAVVIHITRELSDETLRTHVHSILYSQPDSDQA